MNIQNISSDIISTLPQDIIEFILTLMPIRDAVRTSILSRKWKFCWTNIPKLVFDDKLVKEIATCKLLKKEKLACAIFRVLLLHTGSILEFNLNVGQYKMSLELDIIIRYLSWRNIVEKLVFEMPNKYCYKLPALFFSFTELKDLWLTNCDFDPPLTFDGFRRLKSVHFLDVTITSKVLQRFLSNCPLLTEVILDGCGGEQDFEGGSKFTFVELLRCVPLIERLAISKFYMKYLSTGGKSQKLPTSLSNINLLCLDVCVTEQDEISSALCLIKNSPNLQKIVYLSHQKLDAPPVTFNIQDFQDYSTFNFDYLEELLMLNFSNLSLELEFVKLVMGKSPVLEKVRIDLSTKVSVDEELKILRYFKRPPFTLASPSAKFIIKR
ncbi:F-box/FBD/LRR-repeat protein-like protein [Tanacetum coccineum]